MHSPVPLLDGHDPEVVRSNVRALSERMPYPNACGVALDRARRWWEWEHPGAELPPHLRRRADENLAIGSYEVSTADSDYDAPLARARSAEAAHRASRRMNLIDAPVEVVEIGGDENMLVGGRRVVISAALHGRSVALRPPTSPRLGPDFKKYTDAARPASYDRAVNAQVGPLSAAPGIIERLRAAGFEVDVSPELAAAIAATPRAAVDSKGTVHATVAGETIILRPVGRLGSSLFDAYRVAARPAVWDARVGGQAGPLEAAREIFGRLRAAGFEVDATKEVLDAAEAAASAAEGRPKSRGLVSVAPATTRNGVSGAAFRRPPSLEGESLRIYRDLTKDAIWDGAESNVAALAAAPKIIQTLSDEGFSVSVEPTLAEALKKFVEQAHEDVSAGRERVERLDAELRKEGKRLYDWQKEGVAWLSGRQTALLLDDPGLGKTVQTIVSLPPGAPAVIVAPATVKGNWQDEFEMWRPEYRTAVLDTKSREPFRWPEPGEVVITNYSNLPDPSEYGPPREGTVLVADEAQDLKNGVEAARGRRFKAMAEAVRAHGGRTWGLTGTPMENKAFELWNILEIFGVADHAFGTKTRFARLFGGELVQGRGRVPTHWEFNDPPDTPAVVEGLNRVSLGRDKLLALKELPPKKYEIVQVELEPGDKAKLEEELRDAGIDVDAVVAAIESAEADADEVPQFREMARAREILARAKIPGLLEIVSRYEAAGEPIVVFSSHKAPIRVLASRPGWAELSGDVPTKRRTQIVRDFKKGKYRGIAATIRSSGTGITLTRARTAVFLDQDWTPTKNLQAADRIHRIGQTREVEVKILVADHAIDQRVAEILEGKRQLIDSTVNAARRMKLSEEEIDDQPDVDFGSLEARARREAEAWARREREIAEEQERLRRLGEEERARELERIKRDLERTEREREEEKRRRSEEGKTKRARARAAALEDEDDPERRPAADDLEGWAADAVVQLARLDPDGAALENGVGFSKSDVGVGHWLAGEVGAGLGLTGGQWRLALELARRYRGQVGAPPKRSRSAGREDD